MSRPRLITYARVSSDGQRERETIETQRTQLSTLRDGQPEWELLHHIEDDGISGETIDARPGFSRIMRLAKEGAFDILAVTKADRLTRSKNEMDCATIIGGLREGNVKIAIPGQGALIDPKDPTQSLMLVIMMSFSSFDKQQILKNTYGGRVTAIKSGSGKNGGIDPYGYQWRQAHAGRSKRGAYEILETEAIVVRRMVELSLDGVSFFRITQILDSEGLKARPTRNKTSKKPPGAWSTATVQFILRSTHIKGEVKALRGKYIIQVPPIIDEATWTRVQLSISSRTDRGKQAAEDRQDALFAGRLKCGICGYSMILNSGRHSRSYRCHTMHQYKRLFMSGPCGNGKHRARDLDAFLWGELKAILTSRASLVQCTAMQQAHVQQGVDFAGDLEDWTKKLAKLARFREETMKRRKKDLISEAECDHELLKLKREREHIERQVEFAKAQLANSGETLQWLTHIEAMASTLTGTLERLTFPEKLGVVSRFLPAGRGWIDVHADGSCTVHGILTRDEKAMEFSFTARQSA